MVDWLKNIQSVGRGIRNGEMTVVMSGRQCRKSVIMDIESQGIEPTFKPGYLGYFTNQHWCHNPLTGKWTYHNVRPYHEYVSASDKIIIRDDEGKFHWYKDREQGRSRELNDEELKDLTFVILGAEHVETPETKWVDISKFRAKQAGIGANPCNEILLK